MKRFCLKLLPVLVLVALTGPPQTTWAQNEAGDGQPPIAGKAKHQHGGLDSILNDVMAAYERTIVSMSKREGALLKPRRKMRPVEWPPTAHP